jgi:serine/threonine protein kinase
MPTSYHKNLLNTARSFLNTIDMYLFMDALEGVNFLHTRNWLHGDLKPRNIGFHGSRAIILDMGGAVKLRPGERVPSKPGTKGTIDYLAPEYEMKDYDHQVDTWSMGVILYELIYGHHPWRFFKNPWRPGHEPLRHSFHIQYGKCIDKLRCELDPRLAQG